MRMDEHIKRLIEKYTLEASRMSGKEALERYQMAYLQAKELGNAFTLRACAANLGAKYISLGTEKEAREGLKILKEATPPEGVSDCVSNGDLFFNTGLGYKVVGLLERAYEKMTHAWEEYRSERDNLVMEISALKRLIEISEARQKSEDAVKWCRQLEESYAQAKRPVDQFRIILKRACLQRGQGQEELSKVVEECDQQLEEIRKQGTVTVDILVEMSVTLAQLKQPPEVALKHLEEANALLGVEYSKTLEKAVVLQNLGTLCNYLELWEKALPYHIQAADIYQHLASQHDSTDSTPPIQPLIVMRCQGHCVANHAYAMVRMDKVDEACKLFNKARELAKDTGDVDTMWQMEEALGAVQFRLACMDLDLPSRRDASRKVPLTKSRMGYLDKSLEWFKEALKHLVTAPGGTADVQDRVLEKYTLVKTFKGNATLALPGQMGQLGVLNHQQIADAKQKPKEGASTEVIPDKTSGGKEDSDSDTDDDGGKGGDEDGTSYSNYGEEERAEEGVGAPGMRTRPTVPILRNVSDRMGRTLHPPAEEDEDPEQIDEEREQMKELYQEQLQERGTLQRTGQQERVKAEVHRQVSSSAESESSKEGEVEEEETTDESEEEREEKEEEDKTTEDSEEEKTTEDSEEEKTTEDSEEEETTEDSEEEEEEEQKKKPTRLPPPPTQSPPRTLQASGTYETPQSPSEREINELYGSPHSRPRPGLHGSTNYAELDFEDMQQKQQRASGELVLRVGRQPRPNFFISSSDDDSVKRTGRRREPDAGPTHSRWEDPDYEPVEIRPASPPARPTHRSRQTEDSDDNGPGGEDLSHGEAKPKKDSKTCAVM